MLSFFVVLVKQLNFIIGNMLIDNQIVNHQGRKYQFKRYLPCSNCCFAAENVDGDFLCNKPAHFQYCEDGGFVIVTDYLFVKSLKNNYG